MNGLIGRKTGMTRIFTENGVSVPVTIIEIEDNRITQIKDMDSNGYYAIQMTTGTKKINKIKKPEAGHFLKAGVAAGRSLWEYRTKDSKLAASVGQAITVEYFFNVKKVDITGMSKGKGFSGTVKRWNFRTQDASHGNSLSHRVPGSVGQNQTPGKVFKGKKMAGQLGNVRVTVQNLEVMCVDIKNNVILIKGAVPGSTGGDVFVKPAVKS